MEIAKSFTGPGMESGNSDPDLDLSDIVRLVLRRKYIVLGCTAAITLLTVLFVLVAERRYRADGEIQVLKEDSSAASLSDMISSAGGAGDSLSVNLTLQTYVGVLTSDTLALGVIQELNLEKTPEYTAHPGAFASDEEKREANLPLAQTRFRREAILRKFHKNLKVSVVSGTRLISVSFQDPSPERAKAILTQILNDFIEYNFQVRYRATEQTTDWLGQQLAGLKTGMEQAQETAVRLQRETGIFGDDGSHNITLARLEALNLQLTNAEENRIVKDAVRQVVHHGDPELISNLSGTAGQSVMPGATNSLALLQSLRQQEATLNTQYADLTSKFGPNYPRVIEVHDQLAAVSLSIKREVDRLRERADSDYQAAANQEQEIRQQFDKQKIDANKANDAAIQYLIARREATSSRDLYESLLSKLKEAGVLAGLKSTNIDILDHAHVGASPASPNVPLILAIGFGAGLVLGIAGAFLRDSLDRSIYTPDELERLSSLALLGVVPLVSKEAFRIPDDTASTNRSFKAPVKNPIAYGTATHPDSTFAESFRAIRTALLLSAPDRVLQVMMVSSAMPHEGKSTLAMNLATVLSQRGGRVLLVDADLRRGTLSAALGMKSKSGLSNIIADRNSWNLEPASVAGLETLRFIPSGVRPPYPAEMLGSEAMGALIRVWRERYEYIVFDTPPVLPVTDAVTFSQHVDGVIMVARANTTTKQAYTRSVRLLMSVKAPCMGAIFNAMDVHSSEYSYYSGYHRYDAKYGYAYGGYDSANDTSK
jgi:capsular exopolysaccharide synthesis family protein